MFQEHELRRSDERVCLDTVCQYIVMTALLGNQQLSTCNVYRSLSVGGRPSLVFDRLRQTG